jgi:hypothetical protein
VARSRVGAALVLLLGCAVTSAGGAAQAAGTTPGTYDVSATAVGIAVQSTQKPAASVVTAGLVDTTGAYSSSALSSYGTAAARAAAVYPGDLVAGGPALLCANLFPCPVAPPDYPLLADAVYPSRPTASAGTPGAGSATARAARDATTGTAAAAAVSAPAPVVVTVGTATATTRVWVDAAGAHALSRSVLHDLTVGPLRIAVLEAVDAVDVSGSGAVRDVPRLTLTGVTVAGQPVAVDDRGVHVVGQDQSLPNGALAQQGLTARLLSTSRQDAKGTARSAAAGLLVTFSVPVSGAPQLPGVPSANRAYLGSALLGGAGVAVAAADLPALQLPQLPPAPAGSAAAVVLPASRGAGPPGVALPVPPGSAPPPATAPALRRLADWLPLPDLREVALLLLVVPLALLVLWRAGTALGRRAA